MQNIVDDNEAAAPGQSEFYDVSDEDEAILKQVKENLRLSRGKRTQWRIDAREDYDFYAGNQWSEEDAATLLDQERPVVVFNRIIRTINAISGLEIQNRQEARYYPRNININKQDTNQQNPNLPGEDDAGYAEKLTDAVKWAKDETNAEDEESESFIDMLICGEGWTDTIMDYDDNPQGMVKTERIDPLLVDIDTESYKRNFEDAKWIAYTRDLTKKEVKEMFPDLELSQLSFGQPTLMSGDIPIYNGDENHLYSNDQGAHLNQPNTIPVTKYQTIKQEKVTLALTQDGNLVEISDKKYKKVAKFIKQMAVKIVSFNRNVYMQYIIVGNLVAEKFKMDANHFTIRPMTGLRDRNKKQWFGLVRIMKDPQRWANKWLSQVQHIINSNNKGGAYVESDAPANFRDFEENYSKPNAILKVNPGKLAGIQERQPLQYPGAADKLIQYAVDAIADTSGVSMEMLGMASRNQPIGLEESRKDSGLAVLAVFFDSLRRYRKIQARIMAAFVREYIADGRLIRILGKTGINYIPLIKSDVAFDYDVIIDDAPSSPRVKERTFAATMKMVDYAIQMQLPVPPEILDYSPLPTDLIQKWKNMIMQHAQPTSEQQAEQAKQQQMNDATQLLMLEQQRMNIEKTQSEIEKNSAQAVKDNSVGQEQSALAFEKLGSANFESMMKHQEFESEQNRKNMEVWLEHHREVLDMDLQRMRESMQAPNQQQQPQMPEQPQQSSPLMQGQ